MTFDDWMAAQDWYDEESHRGLAALLRKAWMAGQDALLLETQRLVDEAEQLEKTAAAAILRGNGRGN